MFDDFPDWILVSNMGQPHTPGTDPDIEAAYKMLVSQELIERGWKKTPMGKWAPPQLEDADDDSGDDTADPQA